MKNAVLWTGLFGLVSLVAGTAGAHERIIVRGHRHHHPVAVAAPVVVARPLVVAAPVVVARPAYSRVVVPAPTYYAPARVGGYYGRGVGIGYYGRGVGVWVGF